MTTQQEDSFEDGFKLINILKNNSIKIYVYAPGFGVPVRKGDYFWNITKKLCCLYSVPNTRIEIKTKFTHSVESVVKITGLDFMNKQTTKFFKIIYTMCCDGACLGKSGYVSIKSL